MWTRRLGSMPAAGIAAPVLLAGVLFVGALLSACHRTVPPGSAQDGGGETGGDDTGEVPWTDPPPGPECGLELALDVDIPINVIGARVVAGRADDETLAALDDLLEQLGELGGPWADQVEGPWRGPPGETLEAAVTGVLSMASVPDVVVDDDGRLWAWFVDGDLGAMREAAARGERLHTGWTGVGGLGGAFSDDGTTWERVDLEFTGDAVPLMLVDPDVLRLPDGRWRMYVLGVPADLACADLPDPAASPGDHQIWMAESDDLVHWATVGVAWAAPSGTADPSVWCLTETECALLVPRNPQPVAARSIDGGLSFDDHGIVLPPGPMSMPDVAWVGDGWWMVAQGDDHVLRSMRSVDGWTWVDDAPPGFEAAGPTVVVDGDDAMLWVHLRAP